VQSINDQSPQTSVTKVLETGGQSFDLGSQLWPENLYNQQGTLTPKWKLEAALQGTIHSFIWRGP